MDDTAICGKNESDQKQRPKPVSPEWSSSALKVASLRGRRASGHVMRVDAHNNEHSLLRDCHLSAAHSEKSKTAGLCLGTRPL